jgi:hypothetical protein
MRGSLSAKQVLNAQEAQINLHKSKLYAQRSLVKGGSILVIDGLEKLKNTYKEGR